MIDVVGGFAIRIQFDREGTFLLEEHSIANRGNGSPSTASSASDL